MRGSGAFLLALAFLALTVPSLAAEPPQTKVWKGGQYPVPPDPRARFSQDREQPGEGGLLPGRRPRPEGADERYVRELLDILKHTKSPDAFQLTLMLLVEGKAEPREAVPVAIRNAERLGLLGRTVPGEQGPKAYLTNAVFELVRELGKNARTEAGKPASPAADERTSSPASVPGKVIESFAIRTINAIEPVPPWATERMEEKYGLKNDFRTPIRPPIREDRPAPTCDEDAPDDAEVLRALKPVARGIPFYYEEFRDDVNVIKERLLDKIDPPRFFPLVGPAQLHHSHWKCIVSYTERFETRYPFPLSTTRPRKQVVYIDKDHLHLYAGPDAPTENGKGPRRD